MKSASGFSDRRKIVRNPYARLVNNPRRKYVINVRMTDKKTVAFERYGVEDVRRLVSDWLGTGNAVSIIIEVK